MAEFDAYFSGNRLPADFQTKVGGPAFDDVWEKIRGIFSARLEEGSIREDIAPDELAGVFLYPIRSVRNLVLLRSSGLLGLTSQEAELLLPNLVTALIDGLKPPPMD